jgi:hypothetical protein
MLTSDLAKRAQKSPTLGRVFRRSPYIGFGPKKNNDAHQEGWLMRIKGGV